jgi:hypothetical protein
MRSSFQKRWGHEPVAKRNGKSIVKARKHTEAVERQQWYDALTLNQKIERMIASPGNSARQSTRLQKELENK